MEHERRWPLQTDLSTIGPTSSTRLPQRTAQTVSTSCWSRVTLPTFMEGFSAGWGGRHRLKAEHLSIMQPKRATWTPLDCSWCTGLIRMLEMKTGTHRYTMYVKYTVQGWRDVMVLIEFGANVRAETNSRCTPRDLAQRQNNSVCLEAVNNYCKPITILIAFVCLVNII